MSLLTSVLSFVFGDPLSRTLKTYQPLVDRINALESHVASLSDIQLKQKTADFKTQLAQGKSLDAILPDAFAVVREAAQRVLGLRHFDVQLIGGIVLHQGKIAEMKTGEGKTLVSTLATYLNALEGKGVYVVTVNDYLARRDAESMGKLFQFLGLSVGLIQADMPPATRRLAYDADITYGTNNEFGFDYLRDHLALSADELTQTRRHFAVVDEVDSILIDEARTPLIISGAISQSTDQYRALATVTRQLVDGEHFTLDRKTRHASLTESGVSAIETALGIPHLYTPGQMDIPHIVLQCIKAHHLYARDTDYVVKDGEVIIVDEFTGRLMDGRRYSDGLHQAIEAIENVPIREESQTLASITFQNYFRLFPKLAGMTGTALTEASEFSTIYRLDVVPIPTHHPVQRHDQPDLVFKTRQEKYKAIVSEVATAHETGQPVLVGTISIQQSEALSERLTHRQIPHQVLNAKFHDVEAEIIAKAGQPHAVTIATNMAGRGTDIKLGDGVRELGGLLVIGSERHESRRIDHQLRGRSGRQGDPGRSRFFVSLEDDLMRLFGSDRIASVMTRLGMPDDTPIEHGLVTRSIERAQVKVERYHFGIRKQILQYDDVLSRQREAIYQRRDRLLTTPSLDDEVADMIRAVLTDTLPPHDTHSPTFLSRWDEAITTLGVIFPLPELMANWRQSPPSHGVLFDALMAAYHTQKSQLPPQVFDDLAARRVILSTLDRQWIDHLHHMESLREGIGLRALGQKDPLVEYKIEGFAYYQDMLKTCRAETLQVLFRIEITIEQSTQPATQPDVFNPFIDVTRLS